MTVSRKILDMFVDGELPSREMDNLAPLLEVHPEWDAYVRKQELLRRMLRGRYWCAGIRSARDQTQKVLDHGTGSRAS